MTFKVLAPLLAAGTLTLFLLGLTWGMARKMPPDVKKDFLLHVVAELLPVLIFIVLMWIAGIGQVIWFLLR